jgi:Na+/proline symporter
MNNLRSEPFLWIHFAGLAVVPLSLQLVWLGLAIGDSSSLFWLEFLLVIGFGIVPILWMQFQKPFNFFSLLIISIMPEQLTDQQRKILALLKTNSQKTLAAIAGIFMAIAMWPLYQFAPLAKLSVDFLPQSRILGVLITILALLATNLFFQVSLSALRILLLNTEQLNDLIPYPVEKIPQDFTMSNIKVKKLLSISN